MDPRRSARSWIWSFFSKTAPSPIRIGSMYFDACIFISRQDLQVPAYPSTHTTPLHATTIHHTLTPSTRHVNELCKIVFPKYSSQSPVRNSLTVEWALPSVNPQPWCFTNESLSLPYAHSLSFCLFLWICVICACFLLYLSFYLCCERWVAFADFCIHNHLFFLFLLFLPIRYIPLARCSCYMYNPAHMSVLLFYLHVYYSNSCVCVSKHVYVTASSSIFVHIYSHFHMYCLCYVLYLNPCLCVPSSFPKFNRHLCYGVYWYDHTSPHIIILWFVVYFHFVICTSTIVRSLPYLSPPHGK